MKKARVVVTIKKDVLDPAGVAVKNALLRNGMNAIGDVRIGRVVDIHFDDRMLQDSRAGIDEIARSILSNPVMEDYTVEISDEFSHDL